MFSDHPSAHSWLNWVDEDNPSDEGILKCKDAPGQMFQYIYIVMKKHHVFKNLLKANMNHINDRMFPPNFAITM